MRASTIKTWLIRILLAVTAVIAVSLLMLSLLGGTSDSHRNGLEQAFSEFMKADVQIGRLEQFNIMPQLVFKTSDIRGIFRDSKDEFLADRLEIAFGFGDLAAGRRRVENFQLQNFRFSNDSKTDLRVDYAGIEDGTNAVFSARGEFEKKDFNLSLPLEKIMSGRPSYSVAPGAALTGNFGVLSVRGETGSMQRLDISAEMQVVMTGQFQTDVGHVVFECLPAIKSVDVKAKADIKTFQDIPFFDFAESCRR